MIFNGDGFIWSASDGGYSISKISSTHGSRSGSSLASIANASWKIRLWSVKMRSCTVFELLEKNGHAVSLEKKYCKWFKHEIQYPNRTMSVPDPETSWTTPLLVLVTLRTRVRNRSTNDSASSILSSFPLMYRTDWNTTAAG
ncbi:hypothetical protein OGAPHI_005783 [Ogataea philodendri]|uniref:Uncharacterized protein n=1 Tax=Ogataea philodendri TaxID=1378263 RepID=A0A9P8P097_9ASCO|nr:uncharacterized protein OGAPHI_005783 [Ogataea philodendri]KAH3662531.1 hypothetical protein OGAPHI_005783 [Ogataea philodendri]